MHYVLKKTDVSTITPGKEIEWTELHTGVFSFGMEGDFLFISASDPNEVCVILLLCDIIFMKGKHL